MYALSFLTSTHVQGHVDSMKKQVALVSVFYTFSFTQSFKC